MDIEIFVKIMNSEDLPKWNGNNINQGLDIVRKYLPNKGIEGAGHDIIFSVNIDELVKAGISKEDVLKLQKLNWTLGENEYLACYV